MTISGWECVASGLKRKASLARLIQRVCRPKGSRKTRVRHCDSGRPEIVAELVGNTQDAFPERLLDLLDKTTDLLEQGGLDVATDPAVALTTSIPIKRRVERITAEKLLKRPLELIREQLEQLLLNLTQHLAELKTDVPVNLGKTRAELLANHLGAEGAEVLAEGKDYRSG